MKKILVILLSLFILTTLYAKQESLVVTYEKELEGILTTSGDYFSHRELTAGHESLPMGTIIEFTNPINQKRVELTINDRIVDTNGMFWISGSAANILGIESVYPTKILMDILHQPEVKEIFEDEMSNITDPIYEHDNLSTIEYQTIPLDAPRISTNNVRIEPSAPQIETPSPRISTNSVNKPILDGLSENLETAIGDPRIPKASYNYIQGYGIHIYTSISYQEAIMVSQRLYKYFECPSYIEKYYSPLGNCYRVIAGDYKSESGAMTWYNKLIASIPGIFLVHIY